MYYTVENRDWNTLPASYSRSGLCVMPLRCLSPMPSSDALCMQQSTVFYRRGQECFQQCRPNPAGMDLIASHAMELWKRLACTSLDGYGFRLGIRFLEWIWLLYGDRLEDGSSFIQTDDKQMIIFNFTSIHSYLYFVYRRSRYWYILRYKL